MTQEQFDRVREIISEIDSLESAKKEITNKDMEFCMCGQDIGINFCQWSEYYAKWEIMNIKAISSILRRHEELIRQEIDNRINELKKQIEEI